MADVAAAAPAEARAEAAVLDAIAAESVAGWIGLMAPIAQALVRFVGTRRTLDLAAEQLPGLLIALPDARLREAVRAATFRARIAGLDEVSDDARAEFASPPGPVDEEALRYLSDKQLGRFSFDWRDVWQEEHVSSFVVAKAMRQDILEDLHGALKRAIAEGWTRNRFVAEMTPVLQEKGWWGTGVVPDNRAGGSPALAQLGSPRRLRTIFDVNVRMAHAAGRWERMTRTARPGDLLRYVAVRDERTREAHAAWGGDRGRPPVLLPIDHVFWRTHYPPNGWNCRCMTVLVPGSRVAREGLAPTAEAELARRGFGKRRRWRDTRNGGWRQVPVGIDPGFGYNVGQARLRAFAPQPADVIVPSQQRAARTLPGQPQSPLEALTRERPAPVGELPDAVSDRDAIDLALAVLRDRAARDRSGGVVFDDAQFPLPIDERLFVRDDGSSKATGGRRRWLPLMMHTLLSPDEIWVSIATYVDAQGVTRSVLTRRYVARWSIGGGKTVHGLVVYEEGPNGWRGVSAFPPEYDRTAARQLQTLDNAARIGVRIWRRK